MTWAETALKNSGLRITSHRTDVLKWLHANGRPVTLFDLNKHFHDQINRITLYRILNDLSQIGIIKMFYGQDGQKYIEQLELKNKNDASASHGHLHFQCNSCDVVFCLDNIVVNNLPEGFDISPEQSILIGLCENCH
jgi:Fur family ferric uptake transcriptional regulator